MFCLHVCTLSLLSGSCWSRIEMAKNLECSFVATIIIVMYGWLCNVGHADTFSLRIITLHHHAGCKALESDCKFSFFILRYCCLGFHTNSHTNQHLLGILLPVKSSTAEDHILGVEIHVKWGYQWNKLANIIFIMSFSSKIMVLNNWDSLMKVLWPLAYP